MKPAAARSTSHLNRANSEKLFVFDASDLRLSYTLPLVLSELDRGGRATGLAHGVGEGLTLGELRRKGR